MPQLRNVKHEAFARNLVEMARTGGTQGSAYARAGYRSENGAAEAAASRLLANVKNGVADRVRELMAGGARRAEVTIASLLNELEDARAGATSAEQFSAVTGAIIAKAKLAGLMVDRLEVGAPNAFAEISMAEALEMIADEISPVTAATLAWTLDHDVAAEMPIDEIARVTLRYLSLDDALARHDRLRDALLKAASDGAVLVEAVAEDKPRDEIDHQALAMWTQPKKRTAGR